MLLGFFIFKILAAGYARRARFNVDVLEKVVKAYYNANGKYPQDLGNLPKFYVVSARDRMYIDADIIKPKVRNGYNYDFQLIDGEQFVISASPIGFWNAGQEFGITEKGILRSNNFRPDEAADSHGEVESWKSVDRFTDNRSGR